MIHDNNYDNIYYISCFDCIFISHLKDNGIIKLALKDLEY